MQHLIPIGIVVIGFILFGILIFRTPKNPNRLVRAKQRPSKSEK